jgi:Putative zinc-finger
MTEVPTRLLRDALRDRSEAAGSSACLDTDRLAAWADDEVSARERESIESHAADCPRCQALLAAMAKTTPPAPRRAWWRVPVFGWAASLVAAAAALFVWVDVFNAPRRVTHAPAPPTETIATAKPAPEQAAGPPPNAARPKAADAAPGVPARAATQLSDRPAAASEVLREHAQPPTAVERSKAGPLGQPAPSSSNAVALGAPAAPASKTAAAAASADATVAPAEQTASSPPIPAPSLPPASPVASARSAPPLTVTAAAGTAAFRPRNEPAQMAAKSSAEPAIVSPDGGGRWRIVAGGGVEHSTDGGATWQPQSTGVSVTLTAGAATSSTI